MNEWNENRKSRKSEIYYLQQLITELDANVAHIEKLNKNTTIISERANEVETMLRDRLLNASTEESFKNNAYYSFFSDHTRINTVTARLLTSEIGLKILQSRELQKQLGEYLELVNGALKWEEQWLNLIRSELVKIHHSIGWRGKNRQFASEYEQMMSDNALQSSYAFVSNTQIQLVRNRGRFLNHTDKLLNSVNQELAKLTTEL